jgi:hypothetical protein
MNALAEACLRTKLRTRINGPVVLAHYVTKLNSKLRGLSPRANYTDRAAAAGRRS